MKIALAIAVLIALSLGAFLAVHLMDDDTKYKIQWENKLIIDPDDDQEPHESTK
jgi:hypothetical protein